MGIVLNLSRAGGGTASRVRGDINVVLAVTEVEPVAEGSGEFGLALSLGPARVASFPLKHGSNAVAFDVPVAPESGDSVNVSLEVLCYDDANVQAAWVDLQVTQLDCMVEDTSDVVLSPITMTPIDVMGISRGGTGGGWIQKAGDLLMVDSIEVTGFFTGDAIALSGQAELYGPAWLVPETHVALGAPVAITGDESGWGWIGGSCPVPGLPQGGAYLCEVTLDGGAPILALLFNEAGF
ncbi:hypothetical protein [Thermomonas fusca]